MQMDTWGESSEKMDTGWILVSSEFLFPWYSKDKEKWSELRSSAESHHNFQSRSCEPVVGRWGNSLSYLGKCCLPLRAAPQFLQVYLQCSLTGFSFLYQTNFQTSQYGSRVNLVLSNCLLFWSSSWEAKFLAEPTITFYLSLIFKRCLNVLLKRRMKVINTEFQTEPFVQSFKHHLFPDVLFVYKIPWVKTAFQKQGFVMNTGENCTSLL